MHAYHMVEACGACISHGGCMWCMYITWWRHVMHVYHMVDACDACISHGGDM